jgi:hypothetical protein
MAMEKMYGSGGQNVVIVMVLANVATVMDQDIVDHLSSKDNATVPGTKIL